MTPPASLALLGWWSPSRSRVRASRRCAGGGLLRQPQTKTGSGTPGALIRGSSIRDDLRAAAAGTVEGGPPIPPHCLPGRSLRAGDSHLRLLPGRTHRASTGRDMDREVERDVTRDWAVSSRWHRLGLHRCGHREGQ